VDLHTGSTTFLEAMTIITIWAYHSLQSDISRAIEKPKKKHTRIEMISKVYLQKQVIQAASSWCKPREKGRRRSR
jgi:hypothetical protein